MKNIIFFYLFLSCYFLIIDYTWRVFFDRLESRQLLQLNKKPYHFHLLTTIDLLSKPGAYLRVPTTIIVGC